MSGALLLGCLAISALAPPQAPGGREADLIIRNAIIWTGDSTQRRAQAVAIRGDRFIAVGANAQVEGHRSPRTRVIDVGGRFVTPGFIDDHTHFAQAGALLIGWAVWHAVWGRRHRVRFGMQVGLAGLAVWSFLMASVMIVLDASSALTSDDEQLLARTAGTRRLIVANKLDLVSDDAGRIARRAGLQIDAGISAQTGAGLGDLRRAMVSALGQQDSLRDSAAISNVRHIKLLEDARAHLVRARDAARDGAMPEEFVLAGSELSTVVDLLE